MKAVVDVHNNILFKGNHDECLSYMRTHRGWNDLRYLGEGGLGRYASFLL